MKHPIAEFIEQNEEEVLESAAVSIIKAIGVLHGVKVEDTDADPEVVKQLAKEIKIATDVTLEYAKGRLANENNENVGASSI